MCGSCRQHSKHPRAEGMRPALQHYRVGLLLQSTVTVPRSNRVLKTQDTDSHLFHTVLQHAFYGNVELELWSSTATMQPELSKNLADGPGESVPIIFCLDKQIPGGSTIALFTPP